MAATQLDDVAVLLDPYQFTIGGLDCSTVPVELSSLTTRVGDGMVTLTWTTGSEIENLGYHVYRSLKQDGEYEKLTADLIKGAGNSRTTQTYEFIDQDVQDGKTYFYKLEQIDFDGTREMHGPVSVNVGKETAVKPSTWGAVKALLK
jgi:fibronectin type 3 domain-containing protein